MTYLKETVKLDYKKDLCTGCGMCKMVCPHNVFELRSGKAEILEKNRCMECGACMVNCPAGAIFVDKGVGCAAAVIASKFRKDKKVSCGCGENETPSKEKSCCC